MKSKFSNCIAPVTLLAMLAMPLQLRGQIQQASGGEWHHHYKLIDVGTLGGTTSGLFDSQKMLTPNGTLVGWADTTIPNPYSGCFNFNFSPDCMVEHGFQFKDGVITDLGALPGINSSQAEATNDHGLIVGQSENGFIDPLLGVPASDVVAWTKGNIFSLGTLGGYQGIAFDVNNAGQITGMATNTVPDQFSILGGTQSRAFLSEGAHFAIWHSGRTGLLRPVHQQPRPGRWFFQHRPESRSDRFAAFRPLHLGQEKWNAGSRQFWRHSGQSIPSQQPGRISRHP